MVHNMMKATISTQDRIELLKVIRDHNDDGLSISAAVQELMARGLDTPKAKYVVRQALDRGEVITDREFKLHCKSQVGQAA